MRGSSRKSSQVAHKALEEVKEEEETVRKPADGPMAKDIEKGDYAPEYDANPSLETIEGQPHMKLAFAWFDKRQSMKQEEGTDPVDVDSCQRLHAPPDDHSVVSASTLGFASIAVSEKTPVVSNQRPNKKVAPAPVQETDSNASGRSESSSVFSFRSKYGKLIYCLLIILVLAIVTMAVSAMATRNSRKNREDSSFIPPVSWDVPEEVITEEPVDVDVDILTMEPSPTPMDVPEEVTAEEPDGDILTTEPSPPPMDLIIDEPTASPILLSSHPTIAPTASSSAVPSLAASISPTLVTESPTMSPTETPTSTPSTTPSLTASMSPTLEASASPTSQPTLSFESLEFNSKALISSDNSSMFGSAVAVHKDEMVIGSNGKVVLYRRSQGEWVERDTIVSDDSDFGTVVAINDQWLAVGAPTALVRKGLVRIYQMDNLEMIAELQGLNPSDHFGWSIALSDNRIAVGAPYHTPEERMFLAGEVAVYQWDADAKSFEPMGDATSGQGSLQWCGYSIQLVGDILASSCPRAPRSKGHVQAFKWDGTEWTEYGTEIANDDGELHDRFGHSISLSTTSDNRLRLAVGAPLRDDRRRQEVGTVQVYQLNKSTLTWISVGNTIAPIRVTKGGQHFGHSLSLVDGIVLAVGSPDESNEEEGMVNLYKLGDGNSWEEHPNVLRGLFAGDNFGTAIRLLKNKNQDFVLMVGATQVTNTNQGYVLSYDTEIA